MLFKIFDKLSNEMELWVQAILRNIPGMMGIYLRRFYYHNKINECGKELNISTGVVITGFDQIKFGNFISLGPHTHLFAHNCGKVIIGNRFSSNINVLIGAAESGEILIGNDVLVGPNVVMRASNHAFSSLDIPICEQGHIGDKITIDDDVWIGANVSILAGTTIGQGSIIAAGAVVNKKIFPYSIAAGVPAVIIGNRKEKVGSKYESTGGDISLSNL